MRNFVAATVAATMMATSALAATDQAGPLPSGKPAGLTKALMEDHTILAVVGGGFVITGLVLVLDTGDGALTTGSTTNSTATTTTR
jgi:hypothetical protein